jgi:hypothetical protein
MKFSIIPSLILTLLLASTAAHATLGEPEASIDNVRRATRMTRSPGIRRNAGSATYTVHELKSAGGTIREYVSASGVVFAVTWTGHRSPELKTILGNYEGEYRTLARSHRRARGQRGLSLSSTRLIATRGGHMRRLSGRFLATHLIPTGVNTNDIQ